MIESRSPRAQSLARADAVREARKRLLDTLSAKERIETRIGGLRGDVTLWKNRVEIARRHGDAELQSAAEARLAGAERRLADSLRDRESLDVHVIRLRHEVRSAQGPVTPRSLPAEGPDGGTAPDDDRSRQTQAPMDWATLARHELDQEIERIRRRAAQREGEGHDHR